MYTSKWQSTVANAPLVKFGQSLSAPSSQGMVLPRQEMSEKLMMQHMDVTNEYGSWMIMNILIIFLIEW